MTISAASLDTTIIPRVITLPNGESAYCTDLLHSWFDRETNKLHRALSRVPYPVDDTPHARAFHNQQFIARQSR